MQCGVDVVPVSALNILVHLPMSSRVVPAHYSLHLNKFVCWGIQSIEKPK
jgi:hypothetical protein